MAAECALWAEARGGLGPPCGKLSSCNVKWGAAPQFGGAVSCPGTPPLPCRRDVERYVHTPRTELVPYKDMPEASDVCLEVPNALLEGALELAVTAAQCAGPCSSVPVVLADEPWGVALWVACTVLACMQWYGGNGVALFSARAHARQAPAGAQWPMSHMTPCHAWSVALPCMGACSEPKKPCSHAWARPNLSAGCT